MVPDPAYVAEWFTHARRDLRASEVLAQAQGVHPIVAVAQLQQALEKAIKAFLLSRGWRLIRTHDLGFLLDEASQHAAWMEAYRELCEIATKAYREERYPGAGGIELTMKEARILVVEGREFLDRIFEEEA